MGPFELPPEAVGSLEGLAESLSLPEYDLLLVGDGSGNAYTQPAGWACVAYDRLKGRATVHAGAATCGTNNFAELAPYAQALWFHHQDHGKNAATPVEVVIVSDSELTVRCGNRQYGRTANMCLWAAVEWFERHGYTLTWVHVRRGSNAWNAWADQAAGYVRRVLEAQQAALLGRPGA